MLTILAWIPRIVRMFGAVRGAWGAFGTLVPWVSGWIRRRRPGGSGPMLQTV